MKALIVNADDFGLTSGVNRAIIAAHLHGIVTSATVMVNMPAFAEAVALARAHPSLGVGLHFNITQGRPIAQPEKVASLLNERGEFLGTSGALAIRALRGELLAAHVVNELHAQLRQALSAGLCLTHADSHKHSHALPLVFRALVETLPAYGLHVMRVPSEGCTLNGLSFNANRIMQSFTSAGLSGLTMLSLRRSLRTTDSFFGVAQTGYWTKPWLLNSLRQLPEGVTELMCHPGYDDAALQALPTRLRAARENELSLLTDPEIVAALSARNIRLVNFRHLQNAF